jgi:hypothetical protein
LVFSSVLFIFILKKIAMYMLPKRFFVSLVIAGLFILPKLSTAQQTVSGKVTSLGQALAGVNVSVLNSQSGTVTDAQGGYEIQVESGQVLRFSFVGYRTVDVVVDDMNQTLNINLHEEINKLEEVTVEKQRNTEPGLTPMGKPAKMETNFGTIDLERAGYAVSYVSGEKLNNVHEFVHRALAGKISNFNLVIDIPPKVILRGKNSINLDNAAIWEIDGVIYTDNPPLIDVADVKDVFIIKGLAGTVKYGALGAGGVIVIKTKLGNFKNPSAGTDISTRYTNTNRYQNDALPYALYAQNEPFYLKTYDSLNSLAQAAKVFAEAPYNLNNDPQYRLAVAHKMLQRFGSNLTAFDILEDTRNRHPDNPEVLKAIAYLWQSDKDNQASLPVYRKLLALRPDYAQSYRDLAQALSLNGQYTAAWKAYLKHMNLHPPTKPEGIDKVVFEEMQNLFVLQPDKLPENASMEEFELKDIQQDVRLVFEWNVADAEFEIEFVNPNQQVFDFNHTYRDNNPLLIDEKKRGYNMESFYIDTLLGQWQINLTYHGNGKYDPTYLKVTTFYNWSKSNQRQETKVFKLFQQGC